MYRKIVFLCLSFITLQLSAQYVEIPTQGVDLSKLNLEQFKFGVKITPSISWLGVKHNDAEADGATMKFGLGVSAEYEINPILYVVSGINYNAFGGYIFDSLSLDPTTTTKNNYRASYSQIEIPLGLKLQTPETNNMSYYLQGGVTTGFILSAKEKFKSTIANTTVPSVDILPLTSPSMIGCFAGVGAKYKISENLKFFGEITYKTALSSVAMGNNYETDRHRGYYEPIEIYPACMDFSIGIQF